jgi:hypothetical protein
VLALLFLANYPKTNQCKQGIILMNRMKKLIQIHKSKQRNPEKRIQNSKKEKYISKAERAKLALEAENQAQLTSTMNDQRSLPE